MCIKNCFTSDINFDPRLTIKQARKLGFVRNDENYAPTPNDMRFFLPKNKKWDDFYDIIRFPVDAQEIKLPFDAIQKIDNCLLLVDENKRIAETRQIPGYITSIERVDSKHVDSKKKVENWGDVEVAISKCTSKNIQPDPGYITLLPAVGLDNANLCDDNYKENANSEKEKDKTDIIVNIHENEAECAVNDSKVAKSAEVDQLLKKVPGENKIPSVAAFNLPKEKVLLAKRAIGFGYCSKSFRGISVWDPSNHGNVVVYAVQALIIKMDTFTKNQHIFVGHTSPVTSLAFNKQQSEHLEEHPTILASSQGGLCGLVKIWNYMKHECIVTILTDQCASIDCLSFSRTGAVLAASGKDQQGKSLVVVWDTSSVLSKHSYSVIAKIHTHLKIEKIKVSPTHDMRLVTCSSENLMFWEVNSNQLRSCSLSQSEIKYDGFTDIYFALPSALTDVGTHMKLVSPQESNKPYNLYACTKTGNIIEVDFTSFSVCNSVSVNGLKLTCLKIEKSFVVTGSEDGILRMWPLNMNSAFLEAEHENCISDIQISHNGLKVLVSTKNATLGYLDVTTRKYTTLMRSHLNKLNLSCLSHLNERILTCSDDNSIQVWQTKPALQQLFNFGTLENTPTCVACHPNAQIFAAGFVSGSVKIFNCESSCIISEHQNIHDNNKLVNIEFTSPGHRLVSRCCQGTICLYDTTDALRSGVPLLRKLHKATVAGNQLVSNACLAMSRNGAKLAYVGESQFVVTVATTNMLDKLMKIDVTSGLRIDEENSIPKLDVPLLCYFTPDVSSHLLIVTRSNRLLKIDGKNGALLQICTNIHKKHTTAICCDESCQYIVTCGDNFVIKIWNYDMKKPIFCQLFYGHSSTIHHVQFSMDSTKLFSFGEDTVIVWDFIPTKNKLLNFIDESEMIKYETFVTSGEEALNTNNTYRKNIKQIDMCDMTVKTETEVVDQTTQIIDLVKKSQSTKNVALPILDDDCCPLPSFDVPAPSLRCKSDDSTVIPETLRASDLDTTNVSEFTVDLEMIDNFVKNKANVDLPDCQMTPLDNKLKPRSCSTYKKNTEAVKKNDVDIPVFETESLHFSLNGKTRNRVKNIESKSSSSNKDAIHSNTKDLNSEKLPQMSLSPKKKLTKKALDKKYKQKTKLKKVAPKLKSELIEKSSPISVKAKNKNKLDMEIKSLYKPRHDLVPAASKTFVAPIGQQGLSLSNVVSYNGNSRGNILWNAEEGMLVYSCGSVCVVENLATSYKSFAVNGHTEEISCISMQNNRKVLVTASGKNQLVSAKMTFWSIKPLKVLTSIETNDDEILSLKVSPDDQFLLVIGGYDQTSVSIYTTYNGNLCQPILLANASVSPIIIQTCWNKSTTNKFLTVGDNSSIIFWFVDSSVEKNKDMLKMNVASIPNVLRKNSNTSQTNVFTSVCFHSERHLFFVGSVDGRVSMWETNTNTCIMHWFASEMEICCLDSFSDELFVGGCENYLRLWNIKRLFAGTKYTQNPLDCKLIYVAEHVTSSSFAQELDQGIIGTHSGGIYHVDWVERSLTSLITSHEKTINGVDFSYDGKYLATCCDAGLICIWSTNDFQLAAKFQVNGAKCSCLKFSTKNHLVAVGLSDGFLQTYDINKLKELKKFKVHETSVTCVEFATSDQIICCDEKGSVAFVDVSTNIIHQFDSEHRTKINNIQVSPHKYIQKCKCKMANTMDGNNLCLFAANNRKVSVWSCDWSNHLFPLVDWLTFPAHKHTVHGKTHKKRKKHYLENPPSLCFFHPTDSDLLVYTGYGLDKSIQQYSLSKKQIVKKTSISRWPSCMRLLDEVNIAVVGTNSRLVQLLDLKHATFQDYLLHSSSVQHLCVCKNKLVSTSKFGSIYVWELTLNDNALSS